MVDKTAFPMIPVSHWWQLRRKFMQSIPGTVTASYIAASLDMKETSARSNVLPSLVQLGIIDEQGKTLDRARQWRDDAQYADVCKQMREQVYPQELLDAVPNPSQDRKAAERWFANHTGAGVAGVGRMVSVYTLLMDADPQAETEKPARPKTERSGKSAQKTHARAAPVQPPKPQVEEKPPKDGATDGPGVYINMQIHVSSDATPDQIDKIFESMAKHIYRKG